MKGFLRVEGVKRPVNSQVRGRVTRRHTQTTQSYRVTVRGLETGDQLHPNLESR